MLRLLYYLLRGDTAGLKDWLLTIAILIMPAVICVQLFGGLIGSELSLVAGGLITLVIFYLIKNTYEGTP